MCYFLPLSLAAMCICVPTFPLFFVNSVNIFWTNPYKQIAVRHDQLPRSTYLSMVRSLETLNHGTFGRHRLGHASCSSDSQILRFSTPGVEGSAGLAGGFWQKNRDPCLVPVARLSCGSCGLLGPYPTLMLARKAK